MKGFIYTLISCIAFFAVYAFIDARRDGYMSIATIGMDGYSFAVVYFAIGIICLIFKRTRMIAAGLLLSAGLMWLIGYTLCSSLRFPNHS